MTYEERLAAAKAALEPLRGTQCEECEYYQGKHRLTCSRLTLDSLLLEYEGERWCNQHNLKASQIRDRRQVEQLTLWQGKFHAVRHENNKLRRRMKQQFIKDAAVLDDDEIVALIAGLEDVLAGRLTAIPPRVRRALEGLEGMEGG